MDVDLVSRQRVITTKFTANPGGQGWIGYQRPTERGHEPSQHSGSMQCFEHRANVRIAKWMDEQNHSSPPILRPKFGDTHARRNPSARARARVPRAFVLRARRIPSRSSATLVR